MNDSYQKIFEKKNRVMFVFAHPDDAEIYCGGTIVRLVEDKKQVKLIKMTTGNKGSRDQKITEKELASIREKEDAQALQVLGLTSSDCVNLDLGDGAVENNLKTIELLVKEIRMFKPDLIVTHNPEQVLIRELDGCYYVNHRDHRNTATSVIDAAYPFSRDTLFFPEQINEGLESHSTLEFLFVDSWGHQDTVCCDITNQAIKRTEAIACHKSQYSPTAAMGSTDFFAPEKNGKRFEQFRYVVTD
ncbi:PIG-L family deacetylase [Candidatus Woesebacteria bacterium]|nr:PIG-L family deacetylase [Candidatus Woesebacteria bacterium]